ncbi:Ppx/GppA phosphatase family protein [Nocardia takedensis]
MNLGVLDIGSNAAQFLLVDAEPGARPRHVRALKQPLGIAEDVTASAAIGEDGVRRTVEGVARVLAEARELEVDSFYAYVTAVIRDAPNRDEVLDGIHRATGVRPQFLTGAQEARLTYLAVRGWYGWQAGTLLNLDIGGATMEIAMGRDTQPAVALSLPLGARSLTRGFLAADPPTRPQRKRLRRHVRACLSELRGRLAEEGRPHTVIGSSKTFKQLARIAGPRTGGGPRGEEALSRDVVHATARKLARLSVRERTRLRGVSPARAPHVLAGALIADAAMRELDIDVLEVSPWALREGVVLHHLDPEARELLTPMRFAERGLVAR